MVLSKAPSLMIFPNDWPDWVVSEEGDVVWVRQGVPEDFLPALREASECVCDGGRCMLVFKYRVAMVRPIDAGPDGYANSCGWSDAPLLYETEGWSDAPLTEDTDLQEAMMYGHYEVVEQWGP